MKTSSFSGYKGNKGISIAARSPINYTGPRYPDLYPNWWFFKRYKDDLNEDAYIKAYKEEVLSKLNVSDVYNDLCEYTLLCYENPGEFCHRRIVAEWIYDNINIYISEDNK